MSVLQITDILGNTVKNIEMEGSGEKTIYVGDLHKGIYFGNLVKNGEIIKMSDPIIKIRYLKKGLGQYPRSERLMCISLGENFYGKYYKLIASIFTV